MGDNRIPDNIFKLAVEKAREIETSLFEKRFKDTDKHLFSEKYLERMQVLKMGKLEENDAKITNYAVKKKSTKVKILLIAAIVMLLGSMTVLAVKPLKEVFYQLIEQIFSDHTYVSVEEIGERIDENNKSITPENFEVHKLKNVPEEYQMKYEDILCEICYYSAEYLDKNEQTIAYQQLAVGHFDVWSITSDGTSAEVIAVNGDMGYLIDDDENYHHILYPYEGYVYCMAGYNEVEELVSLLELVFEE